MIKATRKEERTPPGASRTKFIGLILTGAATLLFSASFATLHGQSPDASKTADSKTQLTPQEQSVRRDQAYVLKLAGAR